MRQKTNSILAAAFCVVLFWLVAAPAANAEVWDHKTTITVNQPFEVPGKILPAGKYVLRIVDVAGNRSAIRIFSSDEKTVYATLLGIQDFRIKPTEKESISFYESATGRPRPLHAWFYSGYQYGLEFVYPKTRAVEVARVAEERVIAEEPTPDVAEKLAPEPTVKELLAEPLVAIEPGGEAVEIAAVHPEELIASAPEVHPILPKTASPFPFIALAGLLAAGAASGLRLFPR